MTVDAISILEDIAETTRPRFDVRDLPARERPSRKTSARGHAADPYDRFMSKLDKGEGPDACWTWSGSARFCLDDSRPRGKGGKRTTHAISPRMYAWQLVHDKPPPGKLWPQCGNGRCCNPKHLSTTPMKTLGETRYRMTNPLDPRKRLGARAHSVAPATTRAPATWPASAVSGTNVLGEVVRLLGSVEPRERQRVLRAVEAYWNDERPHV